MDQSDDLVEQVQALQGEVEALRAELRQLRTNSAIDGLPAGGEVPHRAPERSTSRRALLAGAAGVLGAGVATTMGGAPATAATGDPILLGKINTNGTGSGQTVIQYSAAGGIPGGVLTLVPLDNGTDGVEITRGKTHVRLHNSGNSPVGSSSSYSAGSLIGDKNDDLWACVVGGNSSQWRKVAGPATAGSLHVLDSPFRIYDSRTADGKMTNGSERTVKVGYRVLFPPYFRGVADGSNAALINLTVTETNAAGWVAAFPEGTSWPGTSTINWSKANTNLANTTVVGVNSIRQMRLRCAGTTHVVVDVIGYYL